jgi:hypothetical protein
MMATVAQWSRMDKCAALDGRAAHTVGGQTESIQLDVEGISWTDRYTKCYGRDDAVPSASEDLDAEAAT